MELSNVLFSENSGGKLSEQEALVFQFLLQKCLLLFLWYVQITSPLCPELRNELGSHVPFPAP